MAGETLICVWYCRNSRNPSFVNLADLQVQMQKLLFHFPRVTINAPVPGVALNYELEVYIVLESYDVAYPRSSCITISTENTRLYVSLDLDTRTEYYDCSIYRRNQWLALVETHRQVLEGYR